MKKAALLAWVKCLQYFLCCNSHSHSKAKTTTRIGVCVPDCVLVMLVKGGGQCGFKHAVAVALQTCQLPIAFAVDDGADQCNEYLSLGIPTLRAWNHLPAGERKGRDTKPKQADLTATPFAPFVSEPFSEPDALFVDSTGEELTTRKILKQLDASAETLFRQINAPPAECRAGPFSCTAGMDFFLTAGDYVGIGADGEVAWYCEVLEATPESLIVSIINGGWVAHIKDGRWVGGDPYKKKIRELPSSTQQYKVLIKCDQDFGGDYDEAIRYMNAKLAGK